MGDRRLKMYEGDLISRSEVVKELREKGCPEDYVKIVYDAKIAFDPDFLEYQIENYKLSGKHTNVIKKSAAIKYIKGKGLICNDI
jgi:hypothetical protein